MVCVFGGLDFSFWSFKRYSTVEIKEDVFITTQNVKFWYLINPFL